MNNTDQMPMWRIVTIATCSLIIIACLVLLGNINSIIRYDYNYVDEWNYRNKSHIGNISNRDSRGYELDDNWVNIGNHYWYSNDIEDTNSDKDLGDLIRLYSYSINDSSDPHYGEAASLRIYDIYRKTVHLGMSKEEFYQYQYSKYTADTTSIWKPATDFRPFKAATTGPWITIEEDKIPIVYHDYFVVFANDRVYQFSFTNDKYKFFSPQNDDEFNKRCLSVIKDIDFLSYHQWETDYNRYQNLSAKEKEQRILWESILYVIILVFGLGIFFLISMKIGKKNSHAKNLAIYTIICIALSFLIYGAMAIDNPNLDDTLAFVLLDFLPSVLVISLIERFLAKKSHQDYYCHYLIPQWLSSNLQITNEFRKRLLMLFLIYPFFFIVPLPVVGMFFLAFYILPVLLILGIIWIVLWIREGKRMDATPTVQNDKARLYCRHCGKLVDADSEFCRYCGKKL